MGRRTGRGQEGGTGEGDSRGSFGTKKGSVAFKDSLERTLPFCTWLNLVLSSTQVTITASDLTAACRTTSTRSSLSSCVTMETSRELRRSACTEQADPHTQPKYTPCHLPPHPPRTGRCGVRLPQLSATSILFSSWRSVMCSKQCGRSSDATCSSPLSRA